MPRAAGRATSRAAGRAALAVILIGFAACTFGSCRRIGYSREIHSSLRAGPGYSWNGAVYIPATYRLYRVPRGIRRFPDGGQSLPVHEATYILRIGPDNLPGVIGSVDHVISDSAVAGAKASAGETGLILRFPRIGASAGASVIVGTAGVRQGDASDGDDGSWEEPAWDINRTSRALREIAASRMGLPSPMDFGSATRRSLMKDIVLLRGDFAYRREAILRLEPDARDAERILQRMDRRRERMDGYEGAEYQMISRETRDVLIEFTEKGDGI